MTAALLGPDWVIHLPHASTVVPGAVRAALLLSDDELALEILRMTDHLTDELVATALPGAQRVRFPFSRLALDPERFPDDAEEPMSKVGMGVIYEKTSHGLPLRHPPTRAERQRLLDVYYAPHHAVLEAAVSTALELHHCCTVLDMHSFPSRPLPYEPDQGTDRPDICIGTDAFHTPRPLTDGFVHACQAAGLTVAINRPFGGALVPMRYYHQDRRVLAIMIEVNRRLYLDEATGTAGERFSQIQAMLADVLGNLVGLPR